MYTYIYVNEIISSYHETPKDVHERFFSFSLSASVHFQHSAELIRLLSGLNLNYTLQVIAAISPFWSNKLRSRSVFYVNKCHLYTCMLVLPSESPVDSFMTLTLHPFGVRVRVRVRGCGWGFGLELGILQIFLQTIWTCSKLSKCDKFSKWDTNIHTIVPISHTSLL